MGREIRFVKEGWNHPKLSDRDGYQPQSEGIYYIDVLQEYKKELKDWNENPEPGETFKSWTGFDESGPDKKWYMPMWTEEEKTHMQMYEDTSEGTPISPVFKRNQVGELATWLYENKASTFAGMTTSKEAWTKMIKSGFAVSMVISNGIIQSGVDALYE